MSTLVTELLRKYKRGEMYALEQLIEMFNPFIRAYSRKSGWKIDSEDMESILTIKLIETAKGMKLSDSEAKNIKFITSSLKNHFLDVIRKINRLDKIVILPTDTIQEQGENDKEDTVFDDMISILDSKKKEIIKLKFKEMYTDQEIAEKLGVSRQSVNKQLHKAYSKLIEISE